MLRFENLNYQGIEFGGSKDVSGKEHLHLDLWTETAGQLTIYLISSPYQMTYPSDHPIG